jgi:type III pantothenate kinase
MLLAIDVGNTTLHWGLFDGERLLREGRIATKRIADSGWRIGKKVPDQVVISSVVPSVDPLLKKQFPRAQWVTAKNIPLTLRVPHPAQVGADRLVNAFAVWKLYGGPAVIVDFGTATTFCGLSAKGEYLGGAIAPGIQLSFRALYDHTAKLPLMTSLKKPIRVIGNDTKSAMQSGVFYGYVGLTESLIQRFKASLGKKAKIVLTGGYAKLLAPELSGNNIVDEQLTLKGLNGMGVADAKN